MKWQNYSIKPDCISEEYLDLIERFLIYIYDPACQNTGLNQFRMALFKGSLHNNLRLIRPSRVGLLEQIKRASYQSGWIWRHCVDDSDLPDSTNWGWESCNAKYKPRWQMTSNSTDEIVTRTWLVHRCHRCKCRKEGLKCLPFCKCQQKCFEWQYTIILLI